jgi:hypothetical protein
MTMLDFWFVGDVAPLFHHVRGSNFSTARSRVSLWFVNNWFLGAEPKGEPSRGEMQGLEWDIAWIFHGILMIETLKHCSNFLVGGLEHELYVFHSVGNVIIPFDELHHFSEGRRNLQPVAAVFR